MEWIRSRTEKLVSTFNHEKILEPYELPLFGISDEKTAMPLADLI